MNNAPTTEERIWAVLSHLSALTLGMGILLPVIGWAEQRRKSNYASFQCLQALGYQSLGYTIWLLSYLVVFTVFLIIVVAFSFQAETVSESFNPLLGPWFYIIFVLIFGFLVLYLVLPVIAAIACALGRDFRYPIMGNRLARYLGFDATNEELLNDDHEIHWVAAMGHFSVIIALWGILAPLSIWLTEGKQNIFLKFQSIQTLVFQVVVTVLYFVGGFVYLLGIFVLFASIGLTGTPDTISSVGIFGLALFFASLLITFAVVLVIPLMHILGQWAGYRVLRGDDYHYPFIGRLVENRILKGNTSDAKEEPI